LTASFPPQFVVTVGQTFETKLTGLFMYACKHGGILIYRVHQYTCIYACHFVTDISTWHNFTSRVCK